jgi:hypothetical protein
MLDEPDDQPPKPDDAAFPDEQSTDKTDAPKEEDVQADSDIQLNKPQAPPAQEQALGVQGQQGDPSQGQADAADQDMDASGASMAQQSAASQAAEQDDSWRRGAENSAQRKEEVLGEEPLKTRPGLEAF